MAPRILVVDDEIIIARDLESRLRNMGYEVVGIASSGVEAIGLAGEFLPDLILMDIVLKGEMDGIEAAAEIRKRFRLPLIYVTAYTDDQTLARAQVTEPFGYIVKPFLEREVKANIEMALYRHRVERKLERIERWFSSTLEGVAEGVILADREFRVSLLNPVGETITAWPQELAAGRPLQEVFRLVDRNGRNIDHTQVKEGPAVYLSEDTSLVDRGGTRIPVDCMTSGVRDPQNVLTGVITVFRDATGQRHGAVAALVREVAVAVSETTTQHGLLQLCAEAITRNLNVAAARVWLLDPDTNTLALDAGAGAQAQDAPACVPVGEYEVGRVAKTRQALLSNDLGHEPSLLAPAWIGQERIVGAAVHPLEVEGHLLGVVAVYSRQFLSPAVADALGAVARTMASGIQLRRIEGKLERSQKLETIGMLASGVAHDFNNLLTVILGNAQILLAEEHLPAATRDLLDQVNEAGERAANLTRQLLSFSSKQLSAPTPINLNEVVSGMERLLRRIIGEDIALVVNPATRVPPVLLDHGHAEQIIANLAVNARDAMPTGGTLRIATEAVLVDAADSAPPTGLLPGNYVSLTVQDTGIGIAPDLVARVFDPFFTTKAPGKGTGLGLATLQSIVKRAGGCIHLSSALGEGTRVTVHLPATVLRPAARRETSRRAMDTGHETVLVIEDEPAVRGLVARALRTAGYDVLEADSGATALELARDYAGAIHLLLSDVILPEMNGRLIAEHWRAIRPDTRILFMTGYAPNDMLRNGVLPNDAGLLRKPFTVEELTGMVRATLDAPVA
jgi:PAS domain S-box-containing protein